jgi:hypothetical protein
LSRDHDAEEESNMTLDVRALSVLGVVAVLAAVGCIGSQEPGEDVGTAALPQLDGGSKVWRNFTFTFDDPASTQLGQARVFNQEVGTFATGTEYWYVNDDSLPKLGRYGLTVSHTDEEGTSPPADPGYTNQQPFSWAENPVGGWGTGWTTDPISGGWVYSGPNHTYLRLAKSSTTPVVLNSIAWYQVLPSGTSPQNITPDTGYSVVTQVIVNSGELGYDIRQRP